MTPEDRIHSRLLNWAAWNQSGSTGVPYAPQDDKELVESVNYYGDHEDAELLEEAVLTLRELSVNYYRLIYAMYLQPENSFDKKKLAKRLKIPACRVDDYRTEALRGLSAVLSKKNAGLELTGNRNL